MRRVTAIIVNYRTGPMVCDGLRALAACRASTPDLRVVVVDNNSPDESVDCIRRGIATLDAADWIHLEEHPHNGGFSAGNNAGIQAAQRLGWACDHYFLLNPDALVEPDALQHLLNFQERLDEQAILGCVQTDARGTPKPSAFRFPSFLSEFQRGASLGVVARIFPRSHVVVPMAEQPQRVDWVTGAAFLLPVSVVEKIGLMDEGYFLYYEEVAYMRAATLAGVAIWSVPAARVHHDAGASTGIVGGQSVNKPMPLYWYQSWHRYFRQSHGLVGMWCCGLAWMAGHAVNQVLSVVIKGRQKAGTPSLWRFFTQAMMATGH